jgi:hypothetical protein
MIVNLTYFRQINESVVLPNMDDIAFFESAHYTHRGGIWGDACRKGYRSPHDQESISGRGSVNQESVIPPPKSLSTDALMTSTSGDFFPEVELPQEDIASAAESMPSTLNRQSWFRNISSGPSGLSNLDEGKDSPILEENATPDDIRGRTLNVDTSIKRATSVPASKSSPITNDAIEEPPFAQDDSASPSEVSKDSSIHSRVRSLSSGANVVSSEAGSSRESLTPKSDGRPTNTSSFLSTLKSRTDKQALSNTAKEAMRKWSVNWNGFKQNHTGGQSLTDDAVDGAPQGSSSSLFSFPTKNRNYADIRAAVAGRMGKETQESSQTERSLSSPPIDIPRSSNGDGNDLRQSPPPDNGDISLSTSGSPSSHHRTPSLLRKDVNRATISPPKITTGTQSVENLPQSPAIFTPPITAPPIRTQPSQGATMTIPGIHASHKSSIQSYGYTPPTPSVPQKNTRNQTIQSMYKLFQRPSPNSNGSFSQQQDHAIEPSSPRSSGDHDLEPSQTLGDVSTSDRPEIPPPYSDTQVTKLIPPPLPPRSISSSHFTSSPASGSPASFSNQATDASQDVPIAASATDTLKQIAEQDESKRKDLERPHSPERQYQQLQLDREEQERDKRTSASSLRLPAKAKKRVSLGARRIVANVVSDEPESMSAPANVEADMNGGVTGVVDQNAGEIGERSGFAVAESEDDARGLTRGAEVESQVGSKSQAEYGAMLRKVPSPKPQPPPLPPRRNTSTPVVS